MVLHRFVFSLITTCDILYFVFELTICLLYHLQLHTRACAASQWLHAQHSSSAVDVMFAYMRYIACANNLQSSIGGT